MCNQNHQAELNSQPAACGLTYCVVTQKKKKVEGEGEPNQTGLSDCQDVAHVDFFIFGKNLSVRLQNG